MDAQLLLTSVYNLDWTRHSSSLQVCFPAWRNQPKNLPFQKMFQAKSRSSWWLKQNLDRPNSNLCVHFLYFISKLILIFLRNYRFQFLLDQLCRKLQLRRENFDWGGCVQVDFRRHWLPLRKILHVLPLIVYLKAQSKLSQKSHVCVLRWRKKTTLTLVWTFLREIPFIFICAPNCRLSNGSKISFIFGKYFVKFILPNQFKIEFCFWDLEQETSAFREGFIWQITFFHLRLILRKLPNTKLDSLFFVPKFKPKIDWSKRFDFNEDFVRKLHSSHGCFFRRITSSNICNKDVRVRKIPKVLAKRISLWMCNHTSPHLQVWVSHEVLNRRRHICGGEFDRWTFSLINASRNR